MTGYRRGDVILVPYPFGYGVGGRKRPALVVSSDGYNQDTGELVIAQITSRMSAPPRQGDFRIEEWREAKLPRPALVRARLATVENSLVFRRMGSLVEQDFRGAQAAIRSALGIE